MRVASERRRESKVQGKEEGALFYSFCHSFETSSLARSLATPSGEVGKVAPRP